MGKVFISYSHEDLDFVSEINRLLESNYILTWFDKKSIREGDRWEMNISSSISASNTFLVFHSRNYAYSTYCKKEWDMISDRNSETVSRIFIVGLDDFKDSFVKDDIKSVQFVDFNYKNDTPEYLVEKLLADSAFKDCRILREYAGNGFSSTSFFTALSAPCLRRMTANISPFSFRWSKASSNIL